MTAAFRGRDWFGVFVEMLAVVVGVLLGLQASQWADARKAAAEREALVERLIVDLDEYARENDQLAETRSKRLEQLIWLDDVRRSGGVSQADDRRLSEAVGAAFNYDDARPLPISYFDMVSSGSLERLNSPEARRRLERLARGHARQEAATKLFLDHTLAHWDLAGAVVRADARAIVALTEGENVQPTVDRSLLATSEFESAFSDAVLRDSILRVYDRSLARYARNAVEALREDR